MFNMRLVVFWLLGCITEPDQRFSQLSKHVSHVISPSLPLSLTRQGLGAGSLHPDRIAGCLCQFYSRFEFQIELYFLINRFQLHEIKMRNVTIKHNKYEISNSKVTGNQSCVGGPPPPPLTVPKFPEL